MTDIKKQLDEAFALGSCTTPHITPKPTLDERKYREFWICEHGNWYDDKNLADEEQSEKSLTHVIEYAAIAEMQAEIDRLKDVLSTIRAHVNTAGAQYIDLSLEGK